MNPRARQAVTDHLAAAPATRRRGAALLLVLIAVGIATVMGLSFLNSQAVSVGVSKNAVNSSHARAIAESGVEMVMGYVRANADWRTVKSEGAWISNYSFSGGTITVVVQDGIDSNSDGIVESDGSLSDDPTDQLTITSTGSYGGATYVARAVANPKASAQNTVLLVVPDPDHLTAGDAARKAMFEGWGWKVTPFKQDSTEAQLFAAIATVNLVYFPTSMTYDLAAGRLRAKSVGIVCEAASVHDDLQLASSAGFATTGSEIYLLNNTHYITKNLTLGVLPITNVSTNISYIGNNVSASAIMLARRNANGTVYGMLDVVDVGGLLTGGATTDGRRVYLPWGATNFDFSTLNTTGQTILKRSMEWAAGLDGSGPATTNRIAASDYVKVTGGTKIVSFNPSLGEYGGSNSGTSAVVSTNSTGAQKIWVDWGCSIKGSAYTGVGTTTTNSIYNPGNGITGTRAALDSSVTIPAISLPTDMPATLGDKTYGSSTTTLTGDVHVNNLTVNSVGILQFSGTCRVLVDGGFYCTNSGQVRILSGAKVTMYVKGAFQIDGAGIVNTNTANPANLTAYVFDGGNGTVNVTNSGKLYATVVAPARRLLLAGAGIFGGGFLGKQVEVTEGAVLANDTTNTTTIGAASSSSGGSATYTYSVTWKQ